MQRRILAIILLIGWMLISCNLVTTPIENAVQPASQSASTPATVQSQSNDVSAVGTSFSGQGPTTWPIQKNSGMALLHLKVENCGSVVLSGKGQNIPYISAAVPNGGSGDFDDEYQYYTEFQGSENREENIVIDYPIPWNDEYDAPPQTEMLRIEDLPDDCKWDVSILPMNAARSITPGEVLSGEYNDVLAVTDDLRGVELLFMSPGHDRMLQEFGSVIAVTQDTISVIEESTDEAGVYENLPPGTLYLVVDSRGYWELRGR